MDIAKEYKNRCIVRVCKTQRCKLRCFRVPKDEERCRQWLQACGRLDLIKPNFDPKKAYNTYRVCELHFTRSMFNNPIEKSRLLPTAVPLLLVETCSLESNIDIGSSTSSAENTPNKIKLEPDIAPTDEQTELMPPLLWFPVENQTSNVSLMMFQEPTQEIKIEREVGLECKTEDNFKSYYDFLDVAKQIKLESPADEDIDLKPPLPLQVEHETNRLELTHEIKIEPDFELESKPG